MTIRVGLLGYGLAGKVFHAPLITTTAGMTLAAVATTRADEVRRDVPGVRAATVDEVLADDAIDLVVVATPNTAHVDLARRALAAGKHVVVDKPFTNTAAEADDLIALAAAQGRALSVFQNRRWDNDFLTVRQVLASGLLGDVVTYETHYDRFKPEVAGGKWREQPLPGSGVLYDLGAHLIDQALTLFGTPQTVWADARAQRSGAEVDDYFHIVLNFGPRQAILHAGSVVRAPGPRFQVHGTRGSFLKFGLDSQEDALKAGGHPGDPGFGADDPADFGTLTTDVGGLALVSRIPTLPGRYSAYYDGIVAALTAGAPLPVTAQSARATIRVIELAQQSRQTGQTVTFG